MKLLSSLTPDLRPLRESRDFRLLMPGSLVTGMGSQAALVALPFQVYALTGSAFQTGLVGLVELVPVVLASLLAAATAGASTGSGSRAARSCPRRCRRGCCAARSR